MSDAGISNLPKVAKPRYLWFWLGQAVGVFGTMSLLKFMPSYRGYQTPTMIDALLFSLLIALILAGILHVAWFVVKLAKKNTALYGAKKFWLLAGLLSYPLWFAGLFATRGFALNNPEPFGAFFLYWLGVYLLWKCSLPVGASS